MPREGAAQGRQRLHHAGPAGADEYKIHQGGIGMRGAVVHQPVLVLALVGITAAEDANLQGTHIVVPYRKGEAEDLGGVITQFHQETAVFFGHAEIGIEIVLHPHQVVFLINIVGMGDKDRIAAGGFVRLGRTPPHVQGYILAVVAGIAAAVAGPSQFFKSLQDIFTQDFQDPVLGVLAYINGTHTFANLRITSQIRSIWASCRLLPEGR